MKIQADVLATHLKAVDLNGRLNSDEKQRIGCIVSPGFMVEAWDPPAGDVIALVWGNYDWKDRFGIGEPSHLLKVIKSYSGEIDVTFADRRLIIDGDIGRISYVCADPDLIQKLPKPFAYYEDTYIKNALAPGGVGPIRVTMTGAMVKKITKLQKLIDAEVIVMRVVNGVLVLRTSGTNSHEGELEIAKVTGEANLKMNATAFMDALSSISPAENDEIKIAIAAEAMMMQWSFVSYIVSKLTETK